MPHNIENQLRDKLYNREIAPSESVWNRVQKKIPNEKPKRKMLWPAVAAVLAGSVLLALWPSQQEQRLPEVIVEAESVQSNLRSVESITKMVVTEANMNQGKIKVKAKSVLYPGEKFPADKAQLSNFKAVQIENPALIEQQKENEIVAQIKTLEESGTLITDVLLDSLINQSRKQLAAEKLLGKPTTDPNSLLTEAEKDLDKSFKERMFNALQRKIKIAFTR